MEEPKPPTLYDALCEKGGMYSSVSATVCEIVERWMPQYECDYVVCEEYLKGYNALMNTLKANLK